MSGLLDTLSSMYMVILEGIGETLYMTLLSTLLAYVIGLPIGVLLYVTGDHGMRPMKPVSRIVGFVVNFARSIPFLILMLWIRPVTRAIVGTTIGSNAAVVALVVAAAPFVARMVESSLLEVDPGVIEAAQSMGTSNMRLIYKVLIPEAKPSLITGATITITTVLAYTAMAGAIGAGGLGKIAITYGYNRYQSDVMFITVILLVIIVQIFQEAGVRITKRTDKRN